MTETARDLVIVMTRGTDHELSSVAFTIANGGLTAGLKVYAFLTSASVDLVRKRAIDLTHVPPRSAGRSRRRLSEAWWCDLGLPAVRHGSWLHARRFHLGGFNKGRGRQSPPA